jgi:L-lactate dehydrogenase complex protein LldE
MITCLNDALYPSVCAAAVHVLRSLGVEVDFPASQVCCGQAAFNSGHRTEARRSARAYLRAFRDSEYVVSISGSCTAMVRRYPVLLRESPAEADAAGLAERTFEFSQFLTDVLKVERLPVRYEARVTLHHSCHTLRHLGVREQPERLLLMVDGLEYVPLARSEECCGFGGTFAVNMPAISSSLVDDKAEHVLATGADVLVGLDMSCLMNIGGRLRRLGAPTSVKHLAEVLADGWQA